VGLSVGGDVIR